MYNGNKNKSAGFLSKTLLSLGAVLVAGLFTATAHAFPDLNLVPGTPDIASGAINVSYVGTNAGGVLTASGIAASLNPPGSGFGGDIAGGSFNINSNINFNAQTAGGTLNIGGTIAGMGFNSGSLLTGTFSHTAGTPAFGSGPGDPLEFLFNVTGGDAAALYGGIGSTAGVVLANSGYTGMAGGNFAGNFSSGMFAGVADTFGQGAGVPIPGTLWLLLGGGLLLFRRQKCSKQHG